MENEKNFVNSGNTLGQSARVREAQERARVGIGGALADRLSPGRQMSDCEQAYQAPLGERIERRLRNVSDDATDLLRMQELLRAHPEFETFLELLTLVNRRGL